MRPRGATRNEGPKHYIVWLMFMNFEHVYCLKFNADSWFGVVQYLPGGI